ncbi:MAG: hypothetical protein ACJ8FY_10980 [Gemmataceae bacterium]
MSQIKKPVTLRPRMAIPFALFGLAALAVYPVLAKTKPPLAAISDPKDDEDSLVRDNRQEVLAGAAMLFGIGCQGATGGPAEIAFMKIGENRNLWVLGVGDRAIPLIPAYLAKVRDHRPLANGLDAQVDDAGELMAYADALAKANLSPVDAIANGARRDISRNNLLTDPHRFRGEVIHIEGRLRLVEKLPAPLLVSYLGISEVYEAWIFEQGYGANATCLLLTELPEGLTHGSQNDVPVAFDGYFFKIYRYKSRDRSKASQEREAPLCIGRTLTLLKRAPQTASENMPPFSMPTSLLGVFVGFVVCAICLAVGLTLWLRRNDNRVRQRLKSAYLTDFQHPDSSLLQNDHENGAAKRGVS